MALTLLPWVREQFFDTNGKPLNSGRIFTYAAGTSTKLTTYQDSSASTAHSNPIVLDASGCPPAGIYLQARSYKIVAAAAGSDDPPTSPVWTQDNVSQVPAFATDLDITGTSGEAIAVNEWVYLSAGDGGRTAGAWYKTDQDLDYASTLARKVGIATSLTTAAAQDITVRLGGQGTSFAGLTPGALYYLSSAAGTITSTAPSNPRRVAQAASTTAVIIENDYVEPVKGYIPLYLTACRKVAANVIPAIAAAGGVLASDTTPVFERVNGATDKALRIRWALGVVEEVTWDFPYPPDLDDLSPVEVHLLAAMSGATNAPVIAVGYFEGVGDTNAGGNTAAITGTSIAEYTVTILASNIGTQPNFASVSLTPAAHGTDALYVYAAWIEYAKKLYAA